MKEIGKVGAIAAPELVAQGRNFLSVMRRAFDAESSDNRKKTEALAELALIQPSLPVLWLQIEASLRPAAEKEIAAGLALLLKAFPNVGKDDGAAFGRLLLEDVISQKPSVGALEAGCAHVRRTSRFLPSIAEVLEAVQTAQNSLGVVLERLADVDEMRNRLESSLQEGSKVVRIQR